MDAPKGGYAAAAASAPAPDAGAPFSLPSFPFALPFFGAPAPAPSSAAAAAAPKAAEKEVSPLLPAVLLLFSPLLLVQAVSLQTAARVLPAVAGKVAEQAVALVAGEPEPATKKK